GREGATADIEHTICAEHSGFQDICVRARVIECDRSIPIDVGKKRTAYIVITTVDENRAELRPIATVERNCRVVSDICVADNMHVDKAYTADDSALTVIN